MNVRSTAPRATFVRQPRHSRTRGAHEPSAPPPRDSKFLEARGPAARRPLELPPARRRSRSAPRHGAGPRRPRPPRGTRSARAAAPSPCPSPGRGRPGRDGRGRTWGPCRASAGWSGSRCPPRSAAPTCRARRRGAAPSCIGGRARPGRGRRSGRPGNRSGSPPPSSPPEESAPPTARRARLPRKRPPRHAPLTARPRGEARALPPAGTRLFPPTPPPHRAVPHRPALGSRRPPTQRRRRSAAQPPPLPVTRRCGRSRRRPGQDPTCLYYRLPSISEIHHPVTSYTSTAQRSVERSISGY